MSKYTKQQIEEQDELYQQEVERSIMKYALCFLLANLDEEVLEDIDSKDFSSVEELEIYMQDIIDHH
jgi:hypothetical protein